MGRPFPSRSTAEMLGIALLLALSAVGCKPKIGDKCNTSTDCSQTGDRLCDISQPSGYCTVYNCEPKGSNAAAACPDEASCIAFASDASSVDGCQNDLGSTPYQRTFCMKKCKNGNDCRDGYVCEDPQGDPRFGAVDVDGRTKVCMVAFSAVDPDLHGENGVCTMTSPPASAFPSPPESPGAGGASEGGAPEGTAGGAEAGNAGASAGGT